MASDGMSITITAAKNGGYYFDGWKENGSFVSKESDYSFQIDADRALVALFAKTRVPSGYTQIEYIESNGTEYIDTEVIPDSGTPCQTKVSADIQFLGELDSVTYYFSSYKTYYNYSTKKHGTPVTTCSGMQMAIMQIFKQRNRFRIKKSTTYQIKESLCFWTDPKVLLPSMKNKSI